MPAIRVDIPGCDGYRAGRDGSIWSCWNHAGRKTNIWHKMVPCCATNGYRHVKLRDGRTHKVHHLVLLAFHGNRPSGAECRHLNGKRDDNRRLNVRWGTRLQNAADKESHGTMVRGTSHSMAKLTVKSVLAIRRLYATGASVRVIGKRFGISKSMVSNITRRKNWSHV